MLRSTILGIAIALVATGCQTNLATECASGIICPAETQCAAAQKVCITNDCGNGVTDIGEQCDDGNIIADDGCSPICQHEVCGNGVTDPKEICDDGNTVSGDGCDKNCKSRENCGNGTRDDGADPQNPKEICDDGNQVSGDGCAADCLSEEECGNGIRDIGPDPQNPLEICDDGNTMDGDTCSHDCKALGGCTNGVLDPGEECDDGNQINNDDCRNDCIVNRCGDGYQNVSTVHHEECDEAPPAAPGAKSVIPTETMTCNFNCTMKRCGDFIVNQTAGEQCDSGAQMDTPICNSDCTLADCGDGKLNMAADEDCDPGLNGMSSTCNYDCTSPQCGDGKINNLFTPMGGTLPEACDDNNTTNGDGCSSTCQIESCGNGVTEMVNGEQCDDGNSNDLDACRNNCQLPACGDGIKSASEMCDTNGNSQTCDFNCTPPLCGDSLINTAFTPMGGIAPENCDDGNTTNGDGCNDHCRIESCGNMITESVNGEQCDDGNMDDLDGCRNNCQLPKCGDGIKSTSETCDTNGNTMTCDFDCTMPMCGDGIVNPFVNEQCEDGNFNNGDGCNSMCLLEQFTLNVTLAGNGTGTVTSNPSGINCGSDCDQLYLVGTMVTLTATPSMTATFGGWSGACTGTTTCTVTMNQVKNVTATFVLNQLTVTRSGTGTGTVSGGMINCGMMCSQTFMVGGTVTLTATPSGNSVFAGWSGGGCSGTVTTCMVTMNQATTVNAQFSLDTYALTVTEMGNGAGTVTSVPTGISCPGDCTEPYTAGTMVTLIATPAANSNFTSWGGACSGSGQCIVTMNAISSVTATFTLKKFLLTVTNSGGGTVTSVPTGISCGTDCTEQYDAGTMVTLTAAPAAQKAFAGWSGACSGTGTCVVTMDAAQTVSASFVDNRLTIVREGDGSGTVTSPSPNAINCGTTCSRVYNVGTVVTLTAVAASGSRFAGWSGGGCSGIGTCVVTMNGPLTVTATFNDLSTLTVTKSGSGTGTVTSNPVGINCGSDCNEQYDTGTMVTLTATPTAGSVFVQWTGGGCTGSTMTTCVVDLTANTTVNAQFDDSFTLTVAKAGAGTGSVTSNPAGITCGADCTEDYVDGTMVVLTATASAGSAFTGWTGTGTGFSCPGTGTCTVTMNQARTVTATFALNPTLTVAKAGSGMGSVSSSPAGITCGADCSEAYASGTMVTLTATATAGSAFTGWSGGGCTGTGTCVVTVSASVTVTATFQTLFQLDVMKAGAGTGSVSSSPAGITCGADCNQQYADGTMVVLTATASAGSIFTGWSGMGITCPGTGTCTVTVDAAKTVTATFAVAFTLTAAKAGTGAGTVTSAPTGITCGADCSEPYADGTMVVLTATPSAGSIFTGWSGTGITCPGTGTCTVTVDAAKSVTATFALNTLTVVLAGTGTGSVASSPAGITCGADCSENYTAGTMVTLTATATMGSTFAGWSGGGCTGTGTCVVTMNAATSVTATFDP